MVAGIAVLAGVGLAEEAAKLPSAEDILKRNVAARGGDDRVQTLAIGEVWNVPERP